ncbi:MAG: DUF1343 domain-containing protein [Desulfosarcinaceae bacterium]|nr:DUF1343 domain-containing protein [Desulfosarcinaceae bacterium]
MPPVTSGLENFVNAPPPYIAGQRLGLLCNPASVDSRLRHARHRIHAVAGERLTALYSPQHGFFAEKQDNMIESAHRQDPALGLPIFSLYGETRIPTEEMLAPIDILLVDLQDVGTRVYTFIYTLSYCLEACARLGKMVVVLDRPNPIGGVLVEGNCLNPDYRSFVGRYPIPMRHGLTIGEIARLFNHCGDIQCDLEVVPMQGWSREMLFEATGLPWVAPSPNLPTPRSALVYPGQVIWEGTNVSEGRGTTQPFELFGAPFLDPDAILERMDAADLMGVVLRPIEFEPTAHKWAGQGCRGFQLHVTDPASYRPYRTSLRLLQIISTLYPEAFAWKQPPYEYEFEKRPIDLILGDRQLRRALVEEMPLAQLEAEWTQGLRSYSRQIEENRIYAPPG